MNLLIPYVYLYDHPDPLFEEFTYGDIRARARKLKKFLKRGTMSFSIQVLEGENISLPIM
jgi:hypothetical protein